MLLHKSHRWHFKQWLVLLATCLLLFSEPATAHAQTVIPWTGGAGSGFYYFGANWSGSNVPDNANETAQFDLAGTHNVRLSESIPVTVNSLLVDTGTVTFAGDDSGRGDYTVTNDLRVQDRFNLSQLGGLDDVDLDVGDSIEVVEEGLLFAELGSTLTADRMLVGNSSSGGRVFLESGATLTVESGGALIGLGDGLGQLVFQNNSTGNSITGLTRVVGITHNPNAMGNLTVRSGSTLETDGITVGSTVNLNDAQQAHLNIDGAGSTITQRGAADLTVGSSHNPNVIAELNVTNNGRLNTGTGPTKIRNSGVIKTNTGGFIGFNGDVIVEGGELNGSFSGLTFTVQDGGQVTTNSTFPLRVSIDGTDSLWQTSHVLAGAFSSTSITNGGKLKITSDTVYSIINRSGFMHVNGGELEVVSELRPVDGGILTLSAGLIDAAVIRTSSPEYLDIGFFNFLGGELRVSAVVGNLANQGGTLSPGRESTYGTTTIDGRYWQQTGATLDIDISETQQDLLNIRSDIALLGGDLSISVADFEPSPLSTYTVLQVMQNGLLQNSFDNVANGERLIVADGSGSFQVNYGAGSAFASNEVVLSNFLPNVDLDTDGDVDGRDFLLIQRSDPSLIPAWASLYGSSMQSSGVQPVPEPGALLLGALAAVGLIVGRRRNY